MRRLYIEYLKVYDHVVIIPILVVLWIELRHTVIKTTQQ
jgi:hypothetical protein